MGSARDKIFEFPDKLLLELWEEIFIRLPLKSLVRCRCVCKSWCSFIQSPSFALWHITRSLENSKDNLFTVEYSDPPISTDPYDFGQFEEVLSLLATVRNGNNYAKIDEFDLGFDSSCVADEMSVVGYVHGVLCLRNCICYPELIDLLLLNLSIGKVVTLPFPNMCALTSADYVDLAIGYDYVRNDVKLLAIGFPFEKIDASEVVEVGCRYRECPRLFEVYEVREKSWRCIDVEGDHMDLSINRHTPKVFVNGAVHWSCALEEFDDEPSYTRIFAFDMGREVVSYIRLPKIREQSDLKMRFPVVYEESLSVIDEFETYFNLWVMKQYGIQESWSKLYKIDISFDVSELVYLKKDGVVLYRENNMLMACDVRKPNSRCVVDTRFRHAIYTGTYVESLLLVG